MPSSPATRRASDTADSEQQPPCFSSSDSSSRGHCWRVMPTTSWPAAANRAAATDESTPPERATATFISRLRLAAAPRPALRPGARPHRDVRVNDLEELHGGPRCTGGGGGPLAKLGHLRLAVGPVPLRGPD